MVQQGARQSFPLGYRMGRISQAGSFHIRSHAGTGQIMDAVAAPFDLHSVDLAGISAGHAISQERGFRAGVGEAHALQGVHAGTKQFRQLNLNLVEGQPKPYCGPPAGPWRLLWGHVNEGDGNVHAVQIPVAICVLKGSTCRTRYRQGVGGGESGSARISAEQDLAGAFKHGHGLGSTLAVLRLYALGERMRGGNLKLGRGCVRPS